MSLAWKVTVTVVLFARRGRRGRHPHRQPAGHAPHRRLLRAEARASPSNVTLQTVGTYGSGSHPTWVSYLVQSPARAVGAHDAVPGAPAHPHQRDDLPVRLGQPAAQPAARPGHRAPSATRPRSTASRSGSSTPTPATASAHTFSIPSLGINVPLYGNNGNANLCGAAPCTTNSPHNIIRFSFTTPGPGNYRWQCFVPCGLGFLYGNGGPMSTLGYMGGFMKVVA